VASFHSEVSNQKMFTGVTKDRSLPVVSGGQYTPGVSSTVQMAPPTDHRQATPSVNKL